MSGQGSTANVIAAVCSFFIPGLGQLVQGRILMALGMILLVCLLVGFFTIVSFGFFWWIGYALACLVACIDAAIWKGPR